MDQELLRQFDGIPYPEHDSKALAAEVQEFAAWSCPGVTLDLSQAQALPRRAKESLARHFRIAQGGTPVLLKKDASFASEGFRLERTQTQITLTASDDSGFRYAVCELEERIRSGEYGTFAETPAIPRRITRCFYSPNSRPPLKLDELKDDADYYPEAYLDRIMHDRLNGVWITVYLNDMPCSLFPERGAEAPQILGKLQRVADRCAEYGIKCYLYMAEPRIFADGRWKSGSLDDLKRHPGLAGHQTGNTYQFCTSTEKGKQYLRETVGHIFSTVHGLGGIINIMCQESAHPCALWKLYPHSRMCNCPRCSKRSAGELFGEIAGVMADTIKKYQPDAEFFGWFYASFHMPGEPENAIRFEIADHWPANASMIHNLETGGLNRQLGRDHYVQDYSLSWAGPSDYFFELASHLPHLAAKMQTGCSHEDASVPYLPVPGILYERYRNLRKVNCSAVMQCWYFGSFPGLMNRAAGRLSFDPFPQDAEQFLTELARPEWGEDAVAVGKAWNLFSEGYKYFPENLSFKWCGPLHNSVVCPWYLYPADKPVTPSYTQAFPKNSGDRFGEYFNYGHTPAEIGIPSYRILRNQYINENDPWYGKKVVVDSRFGIETEPFLPLTLHLISDSWHGQIEPCEEAELYIAHQDSWKELQNRAFKRQSAWLYGFDWRGIGESMPDGCDQYGHEFFQLYKFDYHYDAMSRLIGESFLGDRVLDILKTIRLLKAQGVKKITLSGSGIGLVPAVLAAFLTGEKVKTAFPCQAKSWLESSLAPFEQLPQSLIPAGILKLTDLDELQRMVEEENK